MIFDMSLHTYSQVQYPRTFTAIIRNSIKLYLRRTWDVFSFYSPSSSAFKTASMSFTGYRINNILDNQPSDTIHHQTDLNLPIPNPTRSEEVNQSIPLHEKSLDLEASLKNSGQYYHGEHHGQKTSTPAIRLRRFLLPAIFVIVALGGFLAWRCFKNNMLAWEVDLMARALESRDAPLQSQLSPLLP